MKPRKFSLILFPLLALSLSVSCNSTRTITVAQDTQSGGFLASLSQFDYEKDKATGFNRPVSTKDTQPFAEKANSFTGENPAQNKVFETANVGNKRWQGADKKKSWLPWKNSNKEYEYSPKFIKDNSSLAGKVASERNKSFANTQYRMNTASEQVSPRFNKSPDSFIQKKRESFVPPPIISNQSYNGASGRSVEDVKQILQQ